jgi:hypothetical protein
MRLAGLVCAVVLVLSIARAGEAVSFTFEGTTPDTGIDVRFTADLTISGNTLTLVLTNDSLNHANGASPSMNPNDVLTSFYFDVFDGVSRPTLTYTGATGNVCFTANPGADNCAIVDKENDLRAFVAGDNTWQFGSGLSFQPGTETLTFGVGTVGNNSLNPNGFNGNFVDGLDYGLYAGDVTTNNLRNRNLTTGSITFTWSGASGFFDADIGDEVVFGLGTAPDSTATVSTATVPEPETAALLALGLGALAFAGRARRES